MLSGIATLKALLHDANDGQPIGLQENCLNPSTFQKLLMVMLAQLSRAYARLDGFQVLHA